MMECVPEMNWRFLPCLRYEHEFIRTDRVPTYLESPDTPVFDPVREVGLNGRPLTNPSSPSSGPSVQRPWFSLGTD